MITEKDLQEAIAECEGQRNPNSTTCIKLAAFYTIKNYLYPNRVEEQPTQVSKYSFNSAPTYSSKTEFGELLQDKDLNEVMPIMDELMTALSVLEPKIYNKVIRMIEDLNYPH